MAEFLFEIFCEEIPARMQKRAGEDLHKLIAAGLSKAGIEVSDVHHWAGPRRLGFTANIPLKSPDISEERKGPRLGSPEQALAGFMKAAGLSDISEAEIQDGKKGQFYVAKIEKPGREATDIIAELIPDVMNNFPWPKSMKAGVETFRWVRPLQSLICLLDGKVVAVEAGGLTAGNMTEGHRQHGRGPYTVSSFADYKKQLEGKGHVLLDMASRKDKIAKDAKALCDKAGLELVEDEGLLNEVAGLAEWPVVILGDMDPSFLELPGEVIRLSMRDHQKYFAVRDPKTGGLAPNFIVIANQVAPDGGKAIAAGNSRVLSARLSDAQFFQSEDAKRSLEDYYDKLDTVVFHKKLGSIKDKSERVQALARGLADNVGADADKAKQAARLAKCDLVTQTVIEFTSLQGQIGRLMYEREHGILPPIDPSAKAEGPLPPQAGEDGVSPPPLAGEVAAQQSEGGLSQSDHAEIALAIEDHYRPQGPSDKVPTDPVSVAVALADKLDTLVGFWAIDEKPTGSKDPYALRRAALGVVRIILDNDLRIRLGATLLSALQNFFGKLESVHHEINEIYEAWVSRAFESDKEFDQNSFYAELLKKFPPDLLDTFQRSLIFPQKAAQLLIQEKVDGKYRDPQIETLLTYLSFSAVDQIPDVYVDAMDVDVTSIIEMRNKMRVVFHPILIDLFQFVVERLKVHLRNQGTRHDLIDAVFRANEDDLVAIVDRTHALQAFLETDDGTNLLAGYKRAANILKAETKKGDLPDGEPGKGTQAEETALYEALGIAKAAIDRALEKEAYAKAMTALSALRTPIDRFFDDVTVNSDNPAERENRLRLLKDIRDTAGRVANFGAIEG